jgi:hypothetical protein
VARNSYPQKTNNSIEDLVGNEENEYPVTDTNTTMININNELCNIHKKSERTLWKRSLRNSWRRYKTQLTKSTRLTQEIPRQHK